MNVSSQVTLPIWKCDLQPIQFDIRKKYCQHV